MTELDWTSVDRVFDRRAQIPNTSVDRAVDRPERLRNSLVRSIESPAKNWAWGGRPGGRPPVGSE